MQTGEYHGFVGQFPGWLRTQVVHWRAPLLVSALVHVCLFWPKGLALSSVGAPVDIGRGDIHARLRPIARSVQSVPRMPQPPSVRHATVTQASSRRPPLPEREAATIETPSVPAATMSLSSGLDPGAQRSYRIALARMLTTGDLRHALHDPSIAGDLEVGIALAASGQLRDVIVLRGSGNSTLDAVVVAAVRQAARSAPIPAAMQGRDFAIALPVEVGAAAAPTSAAGR